MQVGRNHINLAAGSGILVCYDSDKVAYVNKLLVIVHDSAREKYRVINLDTVVSEKMNDNLTLFFYVLPSVRVVYSPLVGGYYGPQHHGKGNGIADAKKEALLNALRTFDNKPPHRLNFYSFTTQLLKHA